MNKGSLIQNISIFAKEKNMAPEDVLLALKISLESILQEKYGENANLFLVSCEKDIEVYKKLKVKTTVRDFETEININEAKRIDPTVEENQFVHMPITIEHELTRNDLYKLQHIFSINIKHQRNEKEFQKFNNRLYTVNEATIKYVQPSQDVVVDVEGTECLMFANKCLASDKVSYGTKIYVFIYKVRRSDEGFQVFVSRTSPELVIGIMKQEIPDFEKKIVVKSIARIPGVKTKAAVSSLDPSIDAATYCIGSHGVIANAIAKKLGTKERVYFINWSEIFETFLQRALYPMEILKIIAENENIYIVAPDSEFEQTENDEFIIKRKAKLEVMLAGAMIKSKIIVIPESQYQPESVVSVNNTDYIEKLMEQLQIDQEIAELLVGSTIYTVFDLSNVTIDQLIEKIEVFDQEIASQLIERAHSFVTEYKEHKKQEFLSTGADEELFCFGGLNEEESIKLSQSGIMSIAQLAQANISQVASILNKDKSAAMYLITQANADL